MKNVAVLGGAFDPVHKDHMRVAFVMKFGLCRVPTVGISN